MISERWSTIIFLIILVSAAIFQNSPSFGFFNIRPNITLGVLIVAAFFIRSPIFFIFSVIIATAVLGNFFVLSPVFLVFGLASIVGFFVKRFMPWVDIGGSVILAAATTLILYGVSNRSLFITDPSAIIIETLVNSGIVVVLYVAAKRLVLRTMLTA